MFAVIQGRKTKDLKADKRIDLYINAFTRAVEVYARDPTSAPKFVYYGVKFINIMGTEKYSQEALEALFGLIELVKEAISSLTPRELTTVFPVDKEYDGKRYETKDYFFTMDALTKHGLDVPIGDAVDDLLWDYMNINTRLFMVNSTSIIGKLYSAQTGKNMALEFFEEMHLTTYSEVTNPVTGHRFMRNNDTGEIQRVKTKAPRYMQLIAGSN
jgi:hypothetical protein